MTVTTVTVETGYDAEISCTVSNMQDAPSSIIWNVGNTKYTSDDEAVSTFISYFLQSACGHSFDDILFDERA